MPKGRELEAIISIAGQIDPSLQKSIAKATKKFSGLKLGIAAVGVTALSAAAAFANFGVEACKSAAEFETQIANVATLLDGTEAQISQRTAELGADVLEVSNNTGVATDELNDGLYQIISAVGDSEDAIDQMELAAKAAAAGGAETTDAINLLTAVTKGYGDTSGEAFRKASDLSFMTVKLGQTSFPELAASMGKVVPLASALSVSQEELYGAFATLTGVTGGTAEVATQLKAVMSGLMSPTDEMTKALQSLGYSNTNAALESLGLQGTLDALGGTVDGDTQKLAKMFSSVEAQTAILSLAGAQADDFTTKTAAMYEAAGATDKAFETQTDTLEYTIAAIKNLGENFKTSVGQTILPVVKDIAQMLLPMVQTGLETLQPVMAGLFNKASPLIEMLGILASKVVTFLQEIGNDSAKIGLFGTFIENVLPIFDMLLDGVTSLMAATKPAINEFVTNLIPAVGKVIESLVPVLATLTTAASPILEMFGELVVALLPAATQVINALVLVIQMLAPIISETLGNAFKFILPFAENVVNVLTEMCNFITNIFTGNWSEAWLNVQNIFANTFSALTELAKFPINSVVAGINGVIQGINNCGFTIPDWVPGIGGKDFHIDIPEIPMFYSGGFTTGPSLAGEKGTEAVISFDSAYREENLSYWAKAGRMLGVDEGILTAFEKKNSSGQGCVNVTFAPHIVINGSGEMKEDIINALRDEEEEFMDMLEDMLSRRGGEQYAFDY